MKAIKLTTLVVVLGYIAGAVPVWAAITVTPSNVVFPAASGEVFSFDLVFSGSTPSDINAAGFQCAIGISPAGGLTFDRHNSEAVATDLGYWMYGNSGGGAYAHSLGGNNYEFADSPMDPEILLAGDVMARFAFIWDGTADDYTFTLDLDPSNSYVLLDNGTTKEPLQFNPGGFPSVGSSFTIAIPEPTTICLFILGGLGLVRRKNNRAGGNCAGKPKAKKYLISLLLVAALAAQASALDRIWDNGGGDNNWFTTANWDPNGPPNSSDKLTINSGSPATASSVYIGNGGSVIFNNSGTTGSFQTFEVGSGGTGTLDIKTGADVTSAQTYIAYSSGSTGTATVDGSGSTWNTGNMYVGGASSGTLNITNDADVTCYINSYLGWSSSAAGTVTVDDSGSTWTVYDSIYVGYYGTGTLNITSNADVTSNGTYIGYISNSTGTVNVDGAGSTLSTGNHSLYVGDYGTAELNITNNADVTSGTGTIANSSGSTGTVNVDGDGSSWNTGAYTLNIGYAGIGTLNITNGADVTSSGGRIGYNVGSEGNVTVDGYGSTWNTGGSSLYVGYNDYAAATFNVRNDAQVTTGILDIGADGTVNLSGGKISATFLFGQADSMNFTGGELEITSGSLDISGYSPLGSYLSMTGGQVLDVQNGITTIASGSTLNVNSGRLYSDTVQNDGYLSIGSGGLVQIDDGLTNSSSMNMSGGTIVGTGTVTNDFGASFYAKGTIAPAFDNYGTIDLDDVLAVSEMYNFGSVNISTSEMLRHSGVLNNFGTINLNGGAITGEGSVINCGTINGGSAISSAITNDGGLIHANGSSALLITNMSGNINGGEMRVDDGAGINVLTPVANEGTIVLSGANAVFSGGRISNAGTILGRGRVSNQIDNDGVIQASDGRLTLSGPGLTNHLDGRIEALNDSTVFVTQGLAINNGTIALQGGTFDNSTHTISNNGGSITGYGTFRSGGLINALKGGHIGVGYGDLEVIGPVVNEGSFDIEAGSTAVFFDDVSGSGSFGGLGTAMFLGNLSPGSSPGVMSFQTNVTLGSGSKLIMELGGLEAGYQYDVLDVAGIFNIDGILDIELINKFVPQYGNIFDIFNFNPANVLGKFDFINLPALSAGLTWNTSSLYTIGEISVVPEPATICLLGLGALSLLHRRRQKN